MEKSADYYRLPCAGDCNWVVHPHFVLFSFWGASSHQIVKTVGKRELDLTDGDFEDDGNVKLDGDWNFTGTRSSCRRSLPAVLRR